MLKNEKGDSKLTDEKTSDFLCSVGFASQDKSNELSRSPAELFIKERKRGRNDPTH